MKSTVLSICLSMVAAVVFAGAWTSTVGTNAVPVIPPVVAQAAVASMAARVTNTAYTAGTLATVSGIPYICLVAGTSTNVALAASGGDLVDGTVTWRMCEMRPRSGVTVQNYGDTAYLNVGAPAAAGRGLTLSNGGSLSLVGADATQSAIWVVATGETNVVNSLTW